MRSNHTLGEILQTIYTPDQISNATGLAYFAKKTQSGNLSFPVLSSIIKQNSLNCFRENIHFIIYNYLKSNTQVFKITQEGFNFLGTSENRIQILNELSQILSKKVAGNFIENGIQSEPQITIDLNEAIKKEKLIFNSSVEA
jgi:hypothetical protein